MTGPAALDASYLEGPGGVYVPKEPVAHRDEEYDPAGFDALRAMQERHFWYLGRHRFLLHALRRALASAGLGPLACLRLVDLGGGCGGWVRYLNERLPERPAELALADSSARALELAGAVLGPRNRRYQVDLLNLRWRERWDVAFLLDVLEHIPGDVEALVQVREALRPGGLLFVATPALKFFWTYNDDLSHHVRRYARRDFQRLARAAGLELCRARYFMFFLSPLLLLSRWKAPDLANMTPAQVRAHLDRTGRVPPAPLNWALRLVFSLETPLGWWLPFPWGTSVLGVFRRPA
jgi:SAM-dependent methyltransferase